MNMNGILYINGCPIPVAVETVDHYYGEPKKITVREIMSHGDIMDMRNRFEYEMRAKYGDRGFRPNNIIFDELHHFSFPHEIDRTRKALGYLSDVVKSKPLLKESDIKDVIINGPATIIKWKDGTKTVVKCQDEDKEAYSPEAGIAIAVMKKVFGNKGNYNNIFNRLLKKAKR